MIYIVYCRYCWMIYLDSLNCNFLNAFIIGNPIFFRGPGDKAKLNLSYLLLPEAGDCVITRLPAREFFNVNGIKTRLELLIDCGLDIPLEGYVRLVRCLNHYVTRLKPNTRNDGSAMCVKKDFVSLKNPGKKIRTTLVNKKRKVFKLEDQPGVKNFLEITGASFPREMSYESYSLFGTVMACPIKLARFFSGTSTNTRHKYETVAFCTRTSTRLYLLPNKQCGNCSG
jgi:hypothetical protein